jgi:hypothetical protein
VSKELEISLSPEMVERVMREWQEEHPGVAIREMSSDEFARRMMIEVRASARFTE